MHATVPPSTQAPPVPHPLLTEQLPLREAGWRGGRGGVASRAAGAAWPLGLQLAGGQAAAGERPGVCTDMLQGSEACCLAATKRVRHCICWGAAAAAAARVLLLRRARAPAAGGAAAATAAASWSCDCSWQAPATSSSAGHVMEGSALPLRHPPAATPSFRAPCGPSVPLRCAAGWAGSQGVGGKEEAAPSVQGSPGWC